MNVSGRTGRPHKHETDAMARIVDNKSRVVRKREAKKKKARRQHLAALRGIEELPVPKRKAKRGRPRQAKKLKVGKNSTTKSKESEETLEWRELARWPSKGPNSEK